jgi:crotonobetainyl-CoA:carnitine CoA-transferase CaiB-like acyl-CoA transferase
MASGLLAGVIEARQTGADRLIDVAMYDAVVSLCERTTNLDSDTGVAQHDVGNDHPLFLFGVY